MLSLINIVALIPARGGSKGIPGKNIKNFDGKPLICHSIDYAHSSKLINSIYVTTDDNQIAEISKASGAEIINRPPELATDTASTESAIKHAISVMKPRPDAIVLLQPTSPLRPAKSLENAINHFLDQQFDTLLSVTPTHRFFWKVDGKYAKAEYDYNHRPRRQEMTEKDIRYVENGSLYIFSRSHFESQNNRLGGKIGYVVFPEEYSHEIDSPHDLRILEQIAGNLSK